MALDEALMEAARRGAVTLRFYRWNPPCLSFGRNQPARGRYDAEAAAGRGIELVRRPTGGGAVYHDREVTYAVTAPERRWGGPRAAYARINRALAEGLRRLGAPVDQVPERRGTRSSPPGPRACFRDPAPGELTVGGRKLVGSAMWRRSGAVLQHGSVLIRDDQGVAEELRLRTAGASTGEKPMGSVGLVEVCRCPPAPEDVVQALVAGFEGEFGLAAVPWWPSAGELREAERGRAAFAGAEWTWRR